MATQNHDQKFFVQFGAVMGALFVIFGICVTAARILTAGHDAPDEAAIKRLEQRITPPGQAVTDPNVLLAMAAAKPKREAYSGEQVVSKVCGACHGSGMLGAPKIGDHGDWNKRKSAEGGLDGLVKVAIHGKGQMPARGGDADLTDDEIKAAVEQMLK
mgnify:CR=1 FL=1